MRNLTPNDDTESTHDPFDCIDPLVGETDATEHVSVRFPAGDVAAIDDLVNAGEANSTSGFVRRAVRRALRDAGALDSPDPDGDDVPDHDGQQVATDGGQREGQLNDDGRVA